MPTYDYRCEACEHQFEQFQSITAQPLKRCPKCRKSKLRRLIGTGAALLFKGDGFYITDYRSESYKNAAKADSGAAPAATGEAKSGGENQPAPDPKPTAPVDAKPADAPKSSGKPKASPQPAPKPRRK